MTNERQRPDRRILVFTDGLDYGGAETLIVELARRLRGRDWDVRVVTLLGPGEQAPLLERESIAVQPLGVDNRADGGRLARELSSAVVRLARIARRYRPTVLHCHLAPSNLVGRLSALLHRPPAVVCTIHSVQEGAPWRGLAYRLTEPLCDLTTFVCLAGMRKSIAEGRVTAPKALHVPNGIDTRRFRRDAAAGARVRRQLGLGEGFVWLAVGRFIEAKDWPTMLRALRSSEGGGTLLAVGEGPLLERTRRLTEELGIADRVRFLGIRRDVPDLMGAADAYLMTSSWEGMPMVLLEAAASELPIVTTDVGDAREIVKDGETGFVVEPGSASALSAAISRVEQMAKDERRATGEAARTHVVANFGMEKIIEKWEAIYTELAQRRSASAR